MENKEKLISEIDQLRKDYDSIQKKLFRKNTALKKILTQEDKDRISKISAGEQQQRIMDKQGVELTEQWLVKFGFNVLHEGNQHYYIQDPNGHKDSYKIHIFPTINDQWHIAFSDKLSGKEVSYSPTTKIKYVHQLQNLYFALTGEELAIK